MPTSAVNGAVYVRRLAAELALGTSLRVLGFADLLRSGVASAARHSRPGNYREPHANAAGLEVENKHET